MRMTKKLLEIAATIAVIGFLALPLTGCNLGDDDGDGGTQPTNSNQTPVASDYTIGNRTQTTNNITAVTITPKDGKSTGDITIYYAGTGGTTYFRSTTLPTTAGTYTVTFDVAAATDWNAATGLSAGALLINTFVPGNQMPVAGDYTIDNMKQVVGSGITVTIAPKDGKSTGAVTIYYEEIGGTTYGKFNMPPTTAGTYAVTFDVAAVSGWYAAIELDAGTLTLTLLPPTQTFNSIDELSTWLDDQAPNNIATAYTVKLNVSDLGGSSSTSGSVGNLIKNGNKYVSLDLSDSTITSIGQEAFALCFNLISVIIPESVESIEDRAFQSCSRLTRIFIPDNVTSIGNSAFVSCINLTSITIGNSVTSIGQSAFQNCMSLESITVEGGNTAYRSEWNCLISKSDNTLVLGCKNSIIPEGVTSIGQYAFYYCTGLTSVTIHASVTSIGQYAFYYCIGLTSVTFETGSNITSFENDAFPEGTNGNGGDSLKDAYEAADPKAGTYTRDAGGSTWTKG